MFGKNKEDKETGIKLIEENLRQYFERRKNEIDQELNLYKRTAKIKIDEEIANLHIVGNKQIGEYEHTYHQDRQNKMAELAGIDGEIKAKKDVLIQQTKFIEYLMEVINSISGLKNEAKKDTKK